MPGHISSLDEYLSELEDLVCRLPVLLSVWRSLACESRDALWADLRALLGARAQARKVAQAQGRSADIGSRLERVRVALESLREAITDAGLEVVL